MIDRMLGDAFGDLSCRFWSPVLQSDAWVPIHTLTTGPCSQWCPRFLTGGVFEGDIAHRGSVAVLCTRYNIRCNPMHPLNGVLPGGGYSKILRLP